MYLSSNDSVNGVDIDDNSDVRQGNTPSVASGSSQASSSSCPTLLVIDDNSNSNNSSLNTTDIPTGSIPSNNAQTNPIQRPSSPSALANDTANDTPEQQRRRNSSIAKLLGGQPLNNQQYEEIHQQILDDQSAQNGLNHNDNGTDSGIPRSRSSITRTLFANAERNNVNNNSKMNSTSTNASKGRPDSPEFSKNFEYLIRRELDIEHTPATLHPSAVPSVFQNLSTARNTPPLRSSSPLQLKLKRKRTNPKQSLSIPTLNKSSTNAPFALRCPSELDSSGSSLVAPPLNLTPLHRSHHQNDLFRFDTPHRHPRQLQQQQFPIPMNSLSANSAGYPNPKINPSVYSQFTIHSNRLSSTPSSSSSSSYNYCHYPSTNELALPTPVSPLSPHTSSSSSSLIPPHSMGSASRKVKAMYRPDLYDIPVQRTYSTMPNQPHASSPSSPSGHSAPLKKRLLHAYNNEQHSSSSSL